MVQERMLIWEVTIDDFNDILNEYLISKNFAPEKSNHELKKKLGDYIDRFLKYHKVGAARVRMIGRSMEIEFPGCPDYLIVSVRSKRVGTMYGLKNVSVQSSDSKKKKLSYFILYKKNMEDREAKRIAHKDLMFETKLKELNITKNQFMDALRIYNRTK